MTRNDPAHIELIINAGTAQAILVSDEVQGGLIITVLIPESLARAA